MMFHFSYKTQKVLLIYFVIIDITVLHDDFVCIWVRTDYNGDDIIDFDGSTDKRNNILGHLGEQDNFDLWNAKVHLWLCCMYLYDEHLWSTALSPLFPLLLTLEAQAEGVNGQPGLKAWNQIGACTSLLCFLLYLLHTASSTAWKWNRPYPALLYTVRYSKHTAPWSQMGPTIL